MLLLRSVRPDLSGAEAVVLGRSQIVGRPTAALLLAADCTVTIVHSKTADAAAICRRADILVAAIGRPAMVTADWVKPGAIVIDVGINRIAATDGATRLVGDVDFAAARQIAGAITPVPGGVGPMTIACLLQNTVLAAYRRRGLPRIRPCCGLVHSASTSAREPRSVRGCFNRRLCLKGVAVMTSKAVIGMAFAAGCALALGVIPPAKAQTGVNTQVLTNGPQASAGDYGNWSAARNNAESAQYERLLQTSPGFRHARTQKECGPITDAQLRAQCMASFGESSSMMAGSSMPPSQGASAVGQRVLIPQRTTGQFAGNRHVRFDNGAKRCPAKGECRRR